MAMAADVERREQKQRGALGRGVSAFVLGAAVCVLFGGHWALTVAGGGQCAYALQTGRPCLGCGGTRAFEEAVAGHLGRAAERNLLGAFTGVSAWLAAVGALGSLVTGRAAFLKLSVVLVVVSAPAVFVVGAVEWWLASRPHVF